jgi:hypothetical protein
MKKSQQRNSNRAKANRMQKKATQTQKKTERAVAALKNNVNHEVLKSLAKSAVIESFETVNFYTDKEFITVTEFISTHKKSRQLLFNVVAFHDIDATAVDIEKNILRHALVILAQDACDLVKLSSCNFYLEKYRRLEKDNICKFLERQNGKFLFQPEQRCTVVKEVLNESLFAQLNNSEQKYV